MINSSNRITDLVIEAHEIFINSSEAKEQAQENKTPPGVILENLGDEDVKITRVRITSPTGEAAIGKPMGNYITLEVPRLREDDTQINEKTIDYMSKELISLLQLKDNSTILVIGLGNWNVTPDALGPKVISNLMVTKHLLEYVPEHVDKGVRPVCAVSPGVLGITGIETGEIVKGIVDRVKPDVLIAIDALAARSMERVSTTIQIADTGIAPGGGVGNKRMEISKSTVGMPVIAIGVPTVVDAATLTNDAIDLVIDSMIKEAPEGTDFYNMLKNLDRDQKYSLLKESLNPFVGHLIVTPKEIDDIINRVSKVVANGLNMALHQGISLKDVDNYIN
ncbi:GPR endopeptidase [Ruminiclostridium herbifermentans]|uniref:Germination protease n=1 Tax=Ruminiclostridium herbifermentans TaxID=2488810 RepID=A0A4V6EPA2_9FIRM|nr:GPR endopeptidase [Ruminiclostridium herbifermentans]QNU68435.1 GPR endopeptidase [Ruminiclostridium herbifermentans]